MTQANKYPDFCEQEGMRPLNLEGALNDLFPEGLPQANPVRPREHLVLEVESPKSEGGLKFKWTEHPDSQFNPNTKVGKLLTAEERRKICQFLMERHRNEIKRIEAFARTYRG